MTNPPLTVIIHTRNEAHRILACIESARLLSADILVVDMESTDNTVGIAASSNVHVLSFPQSDYVEPAREFGIVHAKGTWVFILDADERITPALANEVKARILSKEDNYTFFKIPRKNMFGSLRWLKHGGWWPDYQTRLIRRDAFVSWPAQIHSTPRITGSCGLLQQPLLHYFHGDITSMVKKTIVYEQIEAELLYRAKRPSGTLICMRKFLGELNRRLLQRLGFLDGTEGIIESIYQAFSKTITYLYLYEKQKSRPV